MPYKAEVIADSSGKWAGNALVFATEAEAELYARDLFGRWFAVRETRVVETDEAANYRFYSDGTYSRIEDEPEDNQDEIDAAIAAEEVRIANDPDIPG